ncbi:MAG: hypothetical protein IJT73_01470, partial [Selenomonadaceae bacterium]|nr:hypothetical protein [Selenomonadaceae bacterium]
MATQQDVIKKFMKVLNEQGYTSSDTSEIAKKALDEAIRTCSQYSGIDDAISKFIAACNNATGDDATAKLLNVCGINISNDDTGAITGKDAGTSTTEINKDDIVPETMAETDTTVYKYTAKTQSAQTINTLIDGKYLVEGTESGDNIAAQGEDTIYAGAGDDTLESWGESATLYGGSGTDEFVITNYNTKGAVIGDLTSDEVLKIEDDMTVTSATFVEGGLIVKTEDGGTFSFVGLTNSDNLTDFAVEFFTSSNTGERTTTSTTTLAALIADKPTDETVADTVLVSDFPNLTREVNVDLKKAVDNSSGTNEVANGSFYKATGSTRATVFNDSTSNIKVGEVTTEITGKKLVSPEFSISQLQTGSDGYLYFETNGLKVRIIGERNGDNITQITAENFSSLPTYQQVILAGLYKWWITESLNLNENSYNLGFTTAGATVNQIDVYFEAGTGNTLAYVANTSDASGQASHLDLVINNNYYSDITNYDDYNGEGTNTNDGAGYLDRTLAHEFTHAIMGANINGFSYLPMFIKEGMAELTHGVDDNRKNEMLAFMNGTKSLSDFVNLTLTSSSQVASGDGTYPYAAGYMFLRWLAKTAAESEALPLASLSAAVNLAENTTGTLYIDNSTSETQTATTTADDISVGTATTLIYTAESGIKQNITYSGGDWKIESIGSHFTVGAADLTAADNVSIYGSGYSNSIKSGAGADYVSVIGGYNTIDAGEGKNTVDGGGVHNVSSQVITGGGEDSINYSGNDATIDAGAGNDYIESYISGSWSKRLSISGGAGDDFIYHGGAEATILGGDGNDYIQGMFRDAYGNSIDGGAGNDKIHAYGTNHTIDGGTGNDQLYNYGTYNTVTGGEGEDVFIVASNTADYMTITDFDVSQDTLYFFYNVNYAQYSSANNQLDIAYLDQDTSEVVDSISIYLDNLQNSIEEFYFMEIYQPDTEDEGNYKGNYLYEILADAANVDNFQWQNWEPAEEIYFLIGDAEVAADNTVTIADNAYCYTAPLEGKMYVKATFDADKNLSLSVVNADGTDASEFFTGKITVDTFKGTYDETTGELTGGEYLAVNYTKDSTAKYTVEFSNVAANSVFNNLGANDTVTTYDIDEQYTITINNVRYVIPAEETAFEYGKGVFISATGDGVQITISKGALYSLADFDNGESITIGEVTYTKINDYIMRSSDNKIFTSVDSSLLANLEDESFWIEENYIGWFISGDYLYYYQGSAVPYITISGLSLNDYTVETLIGDSDKPVTFNSTNNQITLRADLVSDAADTIQITGGAGYSFTFAGNSDDYAEITEEVLINQKSYNFDINNDTTIYVGDNESSSVYAGKFTLTGSLTLHNTVATAVSYTAGTTNTDGVIISVQEGGITALEDFDAGEKITIGDYTYTMKKGGTIARSDRAIFKGNDLTDFIKFKDDNNYWEVISMGLFVYTPAAGDTASSLKYYADGSYSSTEESYSITGDIQWEIQGLNIADSIWAIDGNPTLTEDSYYWEDNSIPFIDENEDFELFSYDENTLTLDNYLDSTITGNNITIVSAAATDKFVFSNTSPITVTIANGVANGAEVTTGSTDTINVNASGVKIDNAEGATININAANVTVGEGTESGGATRATVNINEGGTGANVIAANGRINVNASGATIDALDGTITLNDGSSATLASTPASLTFANEDSTKSTSLTLSNSASLPATITLINDVHPSAITMTNNNLVLGNVTIDGGWSVSLTASNLANNSELAGTFAEITVTNDTYSGNLLSLICSDDSTGYNYWYCDSVVAYGDGTEEGVLIRVEDLTTVSDTKTAIAFGTDCLNGTTLTIKNDYLTGLTDEDSFTVSVPSGYTVVPETEGGSGGDTWEVSNGTATYTLPYVINGLSVGDPTNNQYTCTYQYADNAINSLDEAKTIEVTGFTAETSDADVTAALEFKSDGNQIILKADISDKIAVPATGITITTTGYTTYQFGLADSVDKANIYDDPTLNFEAGTGSEKNKYVCRGIGHSKGYTVDQDNYTTITYSATDTRTDVFWTLEGVAAPDTTQADYTPNVQKLTGIYSSDNENYAFNTNISVPADLIGADEITISVDSENIAKDSNYNSEDPNAFKFTFDFTAGGAATLTVNSNNVAVKAKADSIVNVNAGFTTDIAEENSTDAITVQMIADDSGETTATIDNTENKVLVFDNRNSGAITLNASTLGNIQKIIFLSQVTSSALNVTDTKLTFDNSFDNVTIDFSSAPDTSGWEGVEVINGVADLDDFNINDIDSVQAIDDDAATNLDALVLTAGWYVGSDSSAVYKKYGGNDLITITNLNTGDATVNSEISSDNISIADTAVTIHSTYINSSQDNSMVVTVNDSKNYAVTFESAAYAQAASSGTSLVGSSGNDTLNANADAVSLDGGAGSDTFGVTEENVTITGGADADYISISASVTEITITDLDTDGLIIENADTSAGSATLTNGDFEVARTGENNLVIHISNIDQWDTISTAIKVIASASGDMGEAFEDAVNLKTLAGENVHMAGYSWTIESGVKFALESGAQDLSDTYTSATYYYEDENSSKTELFKILNIPDTISTNNLSTYVSASTSTAVEGATTEVTLSVAEFNSDTTLYILKSQAENYSLVIDTQTNLASSLAEVYDEKGKWKVSDSTANLYANGQGAGYSV